MFSLIPYNRRENNLFRLMDDFERSFFNDAVSGAERFRCDISEKDGSYLLEAELPGFDKKDINIDLENDVLTIRAQHNTESEEKDDKGYLRRERRFGSFSRSFDVSGIDTEQIRADYKNGVLEVSMPKKQELPAPETAKRIEIGG